MRNDKINRSKSFLIKKFQKGLTRNEGNQEMNPSTSAAANANNGQATANRNSVNRSAKQKVNICRKWQDKLVPISNDENSELEKFKNELESYLNYTPNENDLDSVDPLEFYRVNKRFPLLTKMASQLFCLPATSVPSECLFSKAGIIHTELRNRLSSEMLEYYCFLSKNLSLV